MYFFLKKKKLNIFPSDFQALADINLDLILWNGIQTCGQIKLVSSLLRCSASVTLRPIHTP